MMLGGCAAVRQWRGRRVEQQRRGTRQRPDTDSGGTKVRQHLRQTCFELRSAPRHQPLRQRVLSLFRSEAFAVPSHDADYEQGQPVLFSAG